MRRTIASTALILGGLLLAGCATAPGTGTPESATPQIIDIRVGLEPTSLDVTTTSGAGLVQVMRGNVYEGLVGLSEDLEILPALASDWKVSEDGLTYTFTVREGVTFHDGTPMTIDDVVASLTASSAEGSMNPDAKRMGSVASIEATDETTLVITLSQRDINFLESLTTSAGYVVPAASSVDLASATNGTGPYTLDRWNRGSTLALEPFDGYWGDAPLNDGVVFHYIADETTAATALQSGEVDILAGVTAETAELLRGADEFQVIEGDSTSWMTLGFNHSFAPLADQRVRQALRQAIDKEELIEVIGGQALEVGTITVPTDAWHVDATDSAPYDPAAARKLLAEAGQENLNLTLTVSNTYDTIITEFIAAELAEVGVTVTIDTVEFATWLEDVYTNKDFELTMVLHVDPATITYYGNPGYYWSYDNAEAQALVTDARQAATPEVRDEKLRAVAELVAKDAASDWLYSPQTVVVAGKDLTGFPVDRISNNFRVSGITVAE
ncbi:peptide/nickel transport system substrate-binding protein [Microbacterium keratanolyticum]|uniref:ABC transporter substrate-binding protein n=1 Tax=Microbacterium keratanolyticum TaxID=67574 RepID=A0A9W6HP68_9MICO|nr:ABC transporter substrate-binding protein [Microbacterium keratanolyticum]MBM7468312.1 peptide/nickel transport system substrate-binding protein [Microbacterium keratanolyticum]GLK00386.1 ABC transporter substrate-binding protein [Microbacterium keratanolyticum]